jgi:hypothetical protein
MTVVSACALLAETCICISGKTCIYISGKRVFVYLVKVYFAYQGHVYLYSSVVRSKVYNVFAFRED